jgi:RNA polymerase sigma-70 factor (ECF subfamily)
VAVFFSWDAARVESKLFESEESLIEQARHDPEAFGQLYERYLNRIYAYIFYRTGDVREAEDLTARVFYRALAHIAEYDQRGAPFVAWLYRIAHNLVANWHRDRGRKRELALTEVLLLGHVTDAPDRSAEQDEEAAVLLEAIRRLPDERQELLILKFVDDLPNREIGKILSRTEGAVKSLYHRTLLALRADLGKRGFR